MPATLPKNAEEAQQTPVREILPFISDEYQDTADMVFTFTDPDYPGLEWIFRGARTILDSARIAEVEKEEGINNARAMLVVQTLRLRGGPSILPKSYKAPVLDEEGKPVIDEKTGKVKLQPHPMAGKQLPATTEWISKMPESLLVKLIDRLVKHYGGRTEEEHNSFPGPSPS